MEPVEIGLGVPKEGLWLREDVDMKCNVMLSGFVKKTLKKAHGTMVHRLIEKAHITEEELHSTRLEEHDSHLLYYSDPKTSASASPLPSPDPTQARQRRNPFPNPVQGQQNLAHRGWNPKAPYPYGAPMQDTQQAIVDPRFSQHSTDAKYYYPSPEKSGDPLPPKKTGDSQPPIQAHGPDPRNTHQVYAPVELPSSMASSERRMAELDSTTTHLLR